MRSPAAGTKSSSKQFEAQIFSQSRSICSTKHYKPVSKVQSWRFRVGVGFGRVWVVFHQNIVDRALPYLTLNICSHFQKQVLFIETG